mmetsp:Transcript_59422/g.140426  ORF Transcript_59422/g.140426 Transcript_59422/m.140426 type:complete len:278 (+) Transcript_59422:2-835(+)
MARPGAGAARHVGARRAGHAAAQQLFRQARRLCLHRLPDGTQQRRRPGRLRTRLCGSRASGDARGVGRAVGRHGRGCRAGAARHRRLLDPDLCAASARAGAGLRPLRDRAEAVRRPCAGRAAAAAGRRGRALHGRRHRPLRHPCDACLGRSAVLQGRRRGRLLRGSARSGPGPGLEDRRRRGARGRGRDGRGRPSAAADRRRAAARLQPSGAAQLARHRRRRAAARRGPARRAQPSLNTATERDSSSACCCRLCAAAADSSTSAALRWVIVSSTAIA